MEKVELYIIIAASALFITLKYVVPAVRMLFSKKEVKGGCACMGCASFCTKNEEEKKRCGTVDKG